MELIKRKILLEDSTDRTNNSPTWGVMTADTFFVNVFLTQNIDDMGLFTNIEYFSADTSNPTTVDYTILTNKLLSSGYTFPFMGNLHVYPTTGLTETDILTLRLPSNTESSYYNYQNITITGSTDSKIDDVKSYNANDSYIPGFNMGTEEYINYENMSISGVTRVTSDGDPIVYVFDAKDDSYIGTSNQTTGILYSDYSGETRVVDNINIPLTNFSFKGEGFNETNISLSALTKEEYLFGIVSPPEVKSDVFIDRGITSVMDYHLRLSEIKNIGELAKYGNGFYNLTKQ